MGAARCPVPDEHGNDQHAAMASEPGALRERLDTFVGYLCGRDNTCRTELDGKWRNKINYGSGIRREGGLAVERKYGRKFDAYRCWFCGGWHLGRHRELTLRLLLRLLWFWATGRRRGAPKER